MTKVKYKTVNARKFTIRFAWFIGFGYQEFVLPINANLLVKQVCNFYGPFFSTLPVIYLLP